MKKLITLLAIIATIATFAQAPQGFNYQATVRNSAGALIISQNVIFRFKVLQNSATGTIVYSENQSVTTDDLGQVNLVIGQGTATVGTFSTINWGTGNYYLGIELNTGSGYVAMGTTQLLSVPYALYANSSGNSNFNFPNGTNIGDTLNWIWNGNSWVPTPTNTNSYQLPVVSTVLISSPETANPRSGGIITSDGGNSITSKGICWSTNPNPTIELSTKTIDGNGASNFISTLLNLIPSTNYYYRAYATNNIGTGYGATYSFSTLNGIYPTGTISCNNITIVNDVVNPLTGKIWMDRNLGSSRVATESVDPGAFGDLYQWGRRADGHQCRNSSTTTTSSTIVQPWHNNFIVTGNSPWDWLVPQNSNLWQGVNGINNPCPSGYRLPTMAEYEAEYTSWSSNNSSGAINSPLKLPQAGGRGYNAGTLDFTTSQYWTSTIETQLTTHMKILYFRSTSAGNSSRARAEGASVRCIKN